VRECGRKNDGEDVNNLVKDNRHGRIKCKKPLVGKYLERIGYSASFFETADSF